MSGMNSILSKLTHRIMIAVMIGAVSILLFESAEKLGYISDLAESVGRLVVWTFLCIIIMLVAKSSELERNICLTGIFCIVSLELALVFEVTEDVNYLDNLPLIGRRSDVRHFVEKAIMSCWSCGCLLLLYQLVSSLERAKLELESRVQDRTKDLFEITQKLERSKFAIDQASEAILTVNSDGQIVEANRAACVLLGYTEAEITAKLIFDIDSTVTIDNWTKHWNDLKAARQVAIESEQLTKSGARIPVESSVAFYCYEGNEYSCWFIRDITAHKELEQELERRIQLRTKELQKSDQRLKTIVSSAPVVITSIDRDGNIDLFDGQALADVDKEPGCLIGQNYFQQWKDYPELTNSVRAAFAGNTPPPSTNLVNGVFLETRFSPIKHNGQVESVITACVNVTDRIRALEELRSANNQLADALNELKLAERKVIQRERLSAIGEMSSGIAHDLNNALSSVIMYCEMLSKGKIKSEELENAFDTIYQGARQAIGIVKQLQFFYQSSSEAGDEFEPIDLCELIQNSIKLTRPKWNDGALQQGAGITIRPQLPSAPVMVYGSRIELTQVLTNLIFNSVDAMPNGGEIDIRLVDDGDSTSIMFTDNGEGMPLDVQERCFEPFFSRKSSGSGLGLSVCHGVMKRHNGSIAVTSEPGKGTTFHIAFPGISFTQLPDSADHEGQPAISKRILYIDDDANVRHSTAYLLRSLGANVDVVEDGPKGVNLASDRRYDIVISDMGMKPMSGYDVVQALKRTDENLPVAIVSGCSASEVAKRFSTGIRPDYIIEKPITTESIRNLLN